MYTQKENEEYEKEMGGHIAMLNQEFVQEVHAFKEAQNETKQKT